jgi:subtilase family serine protease
VNQRGGTVYPGSSAGWADEISLDLDMVSAACPLCNILLVEAASALNSDLDTAVQEAGTLGATVISLSWGGGDRTDATNSVYHQAGRPILAATGDNGFGVQYPASSRYVIAVGGTRLTRNSTTRGWGETAWSNAGSGCSTHNPAVAPSSFDTGCVGRAEADLSAVADPGTGVAVYDSFHEPGWGIFGGTSASAPIVGAALALLPNPSVAASPQSVYAVAASNFYDVTSGSNGSCSPSQLCNARVGWDGPTGRGTPDFGFLH